MSDYLVTAVDVVVWLKELALKEMLYFPQRHGKRSFRFLPVIQASDVQFDSYLPSVVPPVKLLVPAREELLRFQKKDGKTDVTPALDTSFRIIAGVRPCDLKGIFLMDLFMKDRVADPYYLARRENTAIIGYGCPTPCDDRCFCAAVDSLDHREGADLFLTPVQGGDLLIEAMTALGEELIQGADVTPCEDGPAKKIGAVAARPGSFGRSLKAPVADIPAVLESKYKSPVWERHVRRCFSCGTCNLVCPTCYCFDVSDDLDIDVASGVRERTWDACMLPHFAVVAGGHSFRPEPAARQRHRVKRKFEYLQGRYEHGSACVGCGRCGRQCTTHIDIFNIINDLIEEGEVR
jgi:sulfhydrogenase subunit beta (sulfur reductase)